MMTTKYSIMDWPTAFLIEETNYTPPPKRVEAFNRLMDMSLICKRSSLLFSQSFSSSSSSSSISSLSIVYGFTEVRASYVLSLICTLSNSEVDYGR